MLLLSVNTSFVFINHSVVYENHTVVSTNQIVVYRITHGKNTFLLVMIQGNVWKFCEYCVLVVHTIFDLKQ